MFDSGKFYQHLNLAGILEAVLLQCTFANSRVGGHVSKGETARREPPRRTDWRESDARVGDSFTEMRGIPGGAGSAGFPAVMCAQSTEGRPRELGESC